MTPARRKRIFEAHDGICAYCEEPIDGPFEIDYLLPLALGGADDDGGNTVPMHVECHRLKTFGRRRRRRVGGDANRIAKIRCIRMSRGVGSPKLRRLLTHPRLVRSPDGSIYFRDGSERKIRLLNLPHMPATLPLPAIGCHFVPVMFLWHARLMPDEHDIPISRGDLTFTAHMALCKAEHFFPKRRRSGDHDRSKLVADAVVDHIELCGIRSVRRAPERGRSAPDLWGAVPELEESDDGG